MFGPDKCGNNHKVYIYNNNIKNNIIKQIKQQKINKTILFLQNCSKIN